MFKVVAREVPMSGVIDTAADLTIMGRLRTTTPIQRSVPVTTRRPMHHNLQLNKLVPQVSVLTLKVRLVQSVKLTLKARPEHHC